MLLLASISTYAKDVCSVTQSSFEDFLIRCNNQTDGKNFRNKLKNMTTGSRNDLVMMKMILDKDYDLKAASDVIIGKDFTSTWIFVK